MSHAQNFAGDKRKALSGNQAKLYPKFLLPIGEIVVTDVHLPKPVSVEMSWGHQIVSELFSKTKISSATSKIRKWKPGLIWLQIVNRFLGAI